MNTNTSKTLKPTISENLSKSIKFYPRNRFDYLSKGNFIIYSDDLLRTLTFNNQEITFDDSDITFN